MKRLAALLIGLLLLAGCAPGTPAPQGGKTPAPAPPPVATPPPPMQIMPIAAASPLGQLSKADESRLEKSLEIEGWWDEAWFYGGGIEQELSGLQVDGAREGNRVSIHLVKEESDQFMIGSIYLHAADGRVGYMPIISSHLEYGRSCSVRFADLDGDGTDEIILFFDMNSSGGDGDLHIFTFKNDELQEFYTLIGLADGDALREVYKETLGDTRSPTGVRVFRTESGLALRILLYGQDREDILYGEFAYDGGGLLPLREFAAYTQEEQQAYVRALEPGFRPGGSSRVYMDARGHAASFAGGESADTLFVHTAYAGDTAYLLLEGQRGVGPRRLLRAYALPELGGYNYTIADLDGDGRTEVLLVYGQGDAQARFTMRLLRPDESGAEELLVFESVPPAAVQPGMEAWFTLPLAQPGLPFADAAALNAATGWAEVLPYGEGYCIELEQYAGDGPVSASRIALVDGVWQLVEQGLLREEEPDSGAADGPTETTPLEAGTGLAQTEPMGLE